jgi:hypothetical protein
MSEKIVTAQLIHDENSLAMCVAGISSMRQRRLTAAEDAGLIFTPGTLRFCCRATDAEVTEFLRANGIDETKQLAPKRSEAEAEIDDDHDAEDEARETLKKIAAQCDDRAPFDGAQATRRLTKAVAAKAAKGTPSTKVDRAALKRAGLLSNYLARRNGTG